MKLLTVVVGALVSSFSLEASADFWDQGFSVAHARPELAAPVGSQYLPAIYGSPCLFPTQCCGTGPTTQSVSTYLTFPDGSTIGANYWALGVNNEPAFSNYCPIPTANPGLPDRTHPLYYSTSANWTFYPESFDVVTDTEIGEYFPRAHLIVRHLCVDVDKDEVCESYSHDTNGVKGQLGLPFVSVGAQDGRGNSGAVGELYGSGKFKVKFKARIWDYIEPQGGFYYSNGGLWFFMYAISEWGGKKRGVFLNLKHIGDDSDWSTSTDPGKDFRWNWPIVQSMFYPGVDWAQFDSEDLNAGPSGWHCGFTVPAISSTGVDYQFYVNLKKLFECASARGLFQQAIPSSSQGPLPILGVHWGNEMNGIEGGIWASVHDMKMY